MAGRSEELNPAARAGVVSGAMGGAFLALAGHLALLRTYGTPLPYRDPWKCTGVDVLFPWVNDRLHLGNFFTPLNDHWPVLTRALSFLLVRLNGQWNNLLETSVNALLFAASVATFLLLILPGLRTWFRPAFALMTGAVFALPITWENTLWGIQSLVYLQILLSLLYFSAACTQRTFTRLWWAGQCCAVVLLFTQHSAILAHIAVAVLLAWRCWRSDGDRRINGAGLVIAVSVVGLFATLFPSLHDTASLRADSWAVGLDVFLRQLAWPLPHPGWSLFVYLPWLAWMYDRLNQRRLQTVDAFILVVGLWVGAQAAAIGYGRGAATFTFVSRYCDFLALGFLVNAACLVRLAMTHGSRPFRAGLIVFALFWLVAPVRSFWAESTGSHAGYNLSRRPSENARNLTALRTYFESHDASLITDDNGRGLYSYPPELIPLLDHPAFQALLPPETGSPRARPDGGRLGWLPALLLAGADVIGCFGVLLLVVCGVAAYRRGNHALIPPPADGDALSRKGATILLIICGSFSAVALLAWNDPLIFRRGERLQRIFRPSGSGVMLSPLEFLRGDGAEHPRVDAAGAVECTPEDTRAFAYGTRLSVQPDFRGILISQSIRVSNGSLIIPFTGFPCANGNGLRWRFFNSATHQETWTSYVGPNPGTTWDIWAIDASMHEGEEASLYLFDGREDASGWVGVAQPVQTTDNQFSRRWLAAVRSERTSGAHAALAGFAVTFLAAALVSGISRSRGRSASI